MANKFIKKGDFFSNQNITLKRPGDGISPFSYNKLLKLKAKKNFYKDEKIKI